MSPFMNRAVELALENLRSGAGGPFGAVIVRDGRIIAEGPNQVTATCDPTAHAEVVAIRRAAQALASFDLAGCEIYTSCEPCPMCLGAIYWSRLDRIYYGCTQHDAAEAGFDDAAFYEQLRLPADARSVPMIAEGRSEALAAFEAWKSSGVLPK